MRPVSVCLRHGLKVLTGNFGKFPPNSMQFPANFSAACSQAVSVMSALFVVVFVRMCEKEK